MNTTSALPTQPAPDPALDLVIERVLRAPRAAVWRCWTEPELFVQWWCPKPWVTELRALELRPGGAFHTTMRGPDGGTHYRAVALHPDADACRRHAERGFHEGWGVCAGQLDALACSLS